MLGRLPCRLSGWGRSSTGASPQKQDNESTRILRWPVLYAAVSCGCYRSPFGVPTRPKFVVLCSYSSPQVSIIVPTLKNYASTICPPREKKLPWRARAAQRWKRFEDNIAVSYGSDGCLPRFRAHEGLGAQTLRYGLLGASQSILHRRDAWCNARSHVITLTSRSSATANDPKERNSTVSRWAHPRRRAWLLRDRSARTLRQRGSTNSCAKGP